MCVAYLLSLIADRIRCILAHINKLLLHRYVRYASLDGLECLQCRRLQSMILARQRRYIYHQSSHWRFNVQLFIIIIIYYVYFVALKFVWGNSICFLLGSVQWKSFKDRRRRASAEQATTHSQTSNEDIK